MENRAWVVVVSCMEGRKVKMRLLSWLVHGILMIKDKTCGNMSVCESLVPKVFVHYYQPTLSLVQFLESYGMVEIQRDCNSISKTFTSSSFYESDVQSRHPVLQL